jgi:hypothetical protein
MFIENVLAPFGHVDQHGSPPGAITRLSTTAR